MYRSEGDAFLDRIITTDETIINLFDPETQCGNGNLLPLH